MKAAYALKLLAICTVLVFPLSLAQRASLDKPSIPSQHQAAALPLLSEESLAGDATPQTISCGSWSSWEVVYTYCEMAQTSYCSSSPGNYCPVRMSVGERTRECTQLETGNTWTERQVRDGWDGCCSGACANSAPLPISATTLCML
jgi:hypothetical protein